MTTPRSTGALALLGAILLVAPRGWAESEAPAARAQIHVEEGQAAFDAGNYEEAIREFREAYDLVPEPMLTYNIAVCYERLGDREEAIEHFERYLREEPEAGNAEAVRDRIDRLHRERAEEQDAPLEVSAADDESVVDRVDRTVPRSALESAHHDIGLVVGTHIFFSGVRSCEGVDWNFCYPFSLLIDYHYRLSAAWHIGGGLIGEWAGDPRQSHYGLFLGARYAFHPIPVLEVRAQAHAEYIYIDYGRAIGYEGAHWIMFRLGPTIAWDVYRGFGFRLDLAVRLGYVDHPTREDEFGAGIDILAGIFWAI